MLWGSVAGQALRAASRSATSTVRPSPDVSQAPQPEKVLASPSQERCPPGSGRFSCETIRLDELAPSIRANVVPRARTVTESGRAVAAEVAISRIGPPQASRLRIRWIRRTAVVPAGWHAINGPAPRIRADRVTATSTGLPDRSNADRGVPRTKVSSSRIRDARSDGESGGAVRKSVNGRPAGLRTVIVQLRSVRSAPLQRKSAVRSRGRSGTFTIRSSPSRMSRFPSRMKTAVSPLPFRKSIFGSATRRIGRYPARARIRRDSPATRVSSSKNGPSSAISTVPPFTSNARRRVGTTSGSSGAGTRRTVTKGPSMRSGIASRAQSGTNRASTSGA